MLPYEAKKLVLCQVNSNVWKKETANFKRFKKLIDRWIELALKASRMRVRDTAETHHPTP